MKLRELFSSPEKWTKGAMARTFEGRPVHSHHPDAVCWCFMGGKIKCYSSLTDEESDAFYARITKRLIVDSIIEWNDQATFEQVKALVEELDI